MNAAEKVHSSDETVLYRCGPMGLAISFARCGLFVKAWQNCTEIVATDQRLCGVGKRPEGVHVRHRSTVGKTVFSAPYAAMLSVERADYLLNHALWIRYTEAGSEKDVSVEAGLFWHQHVDRLQEIIEYYSKPE